VAGGCGAPVISSPSVPTTVATTSPGPAPATLTRAEAVAAARVAALRSGGDDVLAAVLTRYGDLDDYVAPGATPPASPDELVWQINLGTNPGPLMGQGEIIVLDAFDGHLIRRYDWVS
jgi:hypothetical protein